MPKAFSFRRLFLFLSAASAISMLPTSTYAAAFQLWEQDGASIGNYHAGRAAIAEDASTAFYNPAGLIRIKNQQAVFGGDPILTDAHYNGLVKVSTIDIDTFTPAVAQGGGFNFIPFFHYAAPICDNVVVAFSAIVPFGLKTDYGRDTMLRYAATLSSVKVLDLSPSIGVALNDKFSLGAGLDIEEIQAEFNQMAGAFDTSLDTYSKNKGHGRGRGYGYHLGALYQFTPCSRIGLSYHSKVTHHLHGKSRFIGPLANNAAGDAGGVQTSTSLWANTVLPPITTLSIFHSLNSCWDLMSSISYIQWNVFQNMILNGVAGIEGGMSTNNLQVIVREGYKNAWSYSVGANYHATEKITLRTGLGYDQSPSNDLYRNVQLPDSDRYAVALGGHFQATCCLGFDIGYTHIFTKKATIITSQTMGDETVTTNGRVKSGADVFGFQVKWDIV